MGSRTSDSCIFCGSDQTRTMLEPEVCDTYGGDYSYQEVVRCSQCGKFFYSYETPADDGRIHNWDRYIADDTLLNYLTSIAEQRRRDAIIPCFKNGDKIISTDDNRKARITFIANGKYRINFNDGNETWEDIELVDKAYEKMPE